MRCLLPNVTRRNPGHVDRRAVGLCRSKHARSRSRRRAERTTGLLIPVARSLRRRTHSRRGDSGTAIRATSSLPSAAAGAGHSPRRHRPPPPRGSHAVGGRGRLAMSIATWSTPRVRPRRWSRARAGRRSGSPRPSVSASGHVASVATRSRRRRRDATVVASAWRRAGAGARPGSRRRPRAPRRGEDARGAPRRASARRVLRCVPPPRPPPRRRLIPRGPERA